MDWSSFLFGFLFAFALSGVVVGGLFWAAGRRDRKAAEADPYPFDFGV